MFLFPKPRRIQPENGVYTVKDELCRLSLTQLFKAVRAAQTDIRVVMDEELEAEEYILHIVQEGITLVAATDEALFRGCTSIWQLMKENHGEIECVLIEDRPQLKRRGYMLDISRGRMPKVETIKTMIDFFALLKYNEFQLYMEGDCFKYSAYPGETESFDCLTPADIRELDAYCRERFIDLVPNQNSFGHMYTWLKKPDFRHLGLFEGDETPSTLNPTLEESFEFICNLYASLLPNFSSEFVNIGLDEAYGLGKYQIEEYCREKGRDVVFMEWLNKLNDHIRDTYGKKVMFWADMIYNYPQSYHMVPKDTIALEWGYELIQSQRMTDHCIAYRDAGVKYYVCPSCNTHGSFTSRMDVTTFNVRTCGELAAEYGAEGLLMTDWGDGGHPQFGVWSMTPCALAGQYGWNPGAKQDGESFKADFIRASEEFVDKFVFGGAKVSRLMYRMANYYLLEPERVHVCTMCAKQLSMPLNQTKYAHLFDLRDSGDDFYFDNVIDYVLRIQKDIDEVEFDNRMKREVRFTSGLITLGAEVCKLKLRPIITREKAEALAARIDALSEEYKELWLYRNYEKGVERFLQTLSARREEILALV